MVQQVSRPEAVFVTIFSGVIVVAALVSCVAQAATARHYEYHEYSLLDIFRLAANEPNLLTYMLEFSWGGLVFVSLVVVFGGVYCFWRFQRGRRMVWWAWLAGLLFPVVVGAWIPYLTVFISPMILLSYAENGFDGEEWSDGTLLLIACHAWIALCGVMAIRYLVIGYSTGRTVLES